MKEIYDWVPWFTELSLKIDKIGEKALIGYAKQINWKADGDQRSPQLLRFGDETVDPFSFIYYLASFADSANSRTRVYSSVSTELDLTTNLANANNEAFAFPIPQAAAALFHDKGSGNPELLWKLFRVVVSGFESMSADDFEAALEIPYVGIKKLSQVMFLANPKEFLPYDDITSLIDLERPQANEGVTWQLYSRAVRRMRDAFPECKPYEIERFAYELSKSKNVRKAIPRSSWVIGTDVYNDGNDHWADFKDNNWVYLGGPGDNVDWDDFDAETNPGGYRIHKPQRGDIVLVCRGKKAYGIGVVTKNDYSEKVSEDARLHTIFINKSQKNLATFTRGAFVKGDGKVGTAFRKAYPETFDLLEKLSGLSVDAGATELKREHIGFKSSADSRSDPSLNTILYGPPGTGKTYSTIRRCIEICDGAAPPNPEAQSARYGKLVDEGRIEFVTFHQSYGYEEFVEGLRPSVDDTGNMRLDVKNGVLKRIAKKARQVPGIGTRRIFKMSLGDPKSWGGKPNGDAIFEECIDGDRVLLEHGGDIDWSDAAYDKWSEIWERWRDERNPDATAYDTDIQAMWRFRVDMRVGDIVVVSDGYRHFRAVGEITGDYEFKEREDGFHHTRPTRWHWHVRGRQGDPVSRFKSGTFQWRPINRMNPANPEGLRPYLHGVRDIGGSRPHVLVIDEINRANISKVMGELITLLEEDKREGAENEITVSLPYSGDHFTLPDNLHILGTMNTADRSIALLDTALRRRFQFEEMAPQPRLLNDAGKQSGVNLPAVLREINKRLEYLADRGHLIGHAWFIKANSREEIDAVMRLKIIPLIAEYFYDDWNKVRAVLGGTDDFVKRQQLDAPPGLETNLVENRFRWSVRDTFPDGAYDNLLKPSTGDETPSG